MKQGADSNQQSDNYLKKKQRNGQSLKQELFNNLQNMSPHLQSDQYHLQINNKEEQQIQEHFSSNIQIKSDDQNQNKQLNQPKLQKSFIVIELQEKSKSKPQSQKQQNSQSVKEVKYLQSYIEKYQELYENNRQLKRKLKQIEQYYQNRLILLANSCNSNNFNGNNDLSIPNNQFIKIIQIPVEMIMNQQQSPFGSNIKELQKKRFQQEKLDQSDFINEVQEMLNEKQIYLRPTKKQKQQKKQMILTPFLQYDKYGDISQIHQADQILENNSSINNAENIIDAMQNNNQGSSCSGYGNVLFQYSNQENNNSIAAYRQDRLMFQISNNSQQIRRNLDSNVTKKNNQNYFQLKKENQQLQSNILTLRAEIDQLNEQILQNHKKRQQEVSEVQQFRRNSLQKQLIQAQLNKITEELNLKDKKLADLKDENEFLIKQTKKFQKKQNQFSQRQNIFNKQIQQLKNQCQNYQKMIQTIQQKQLSEQDIYIQKIKEKNMEFEFITQQYRKLQDMLRQEIAKNKNMIFLVDKLQEENVQFEKIVKRYNQAYSNQGQKNENAKQKCQNGDINLMYNEALQIKKTIQQKEKLYEKKIQKLVQEMEKICQNFKREQIQYKERIQRLQAQLSLNIDKKLMSKRQPSQQKQGSQNIQSQRSEVQKIIQFFPKKTNHINKLTKLKSSKKYQSQQSNKISQQQIAKFNQQKNQLIRSLQKIIAENKVLQDNNQEQEVKKSQIQKLVNINEEKNLHFEAYKNNGLFDLNVQVEMNFYIQTLLNKIQHLQRLLLHERQDKIKLSKNLRLFDQKIKREEILNGPQNSYIKEAHDTQLINQLTIELSNLGKLNNFLSKQNQKLKKIISNENNELLQNFKMDQNILEKKISNDEIILIQKYDKLRMEANELRLQNLGLRNKIKSLQKSSITESNHNNQLKKKQSNLQKKPKYLSIEQFNLINQDIINNFQLMKDQYEKHINDLNQQLNGIRQSNQNKTQPAFIGLTEIQQEIQDENNRNKAAFIKRKSRSLQESLENNKKIDEIKKIIPNQQIEDQQSSQQKEVLLNQNLFPFYKNENYKYDQIFIGNINTLSFISKRKNTERVKYILTEKVIELAINALGKKQGKSMLNSIRPEKILVFHFKEEDPHSIVLKYNLELIENSQSDNSSDKNKTLIYLSPEMLLGSFQQQKSYSWTIGLIIDEIFHGRFFYRRFDEILSHKNNYVFQNRNYTEIAQIVQKLMRKNYNERISLYEALVQVNLAIVQKQY